MIGYSEPLAGGSVPRLALGEIEAASKESAFLARIFKTHSHA